MAEAYVDAKPGDLWTADMFLKTQELIRADIHTQITAAIAAITSVASAQDAAHIGGLTPAELTAQVLEHVLRQLPKRTGYLSAFRKLVVGQESVLEHKLDAYPLVDVYQLDYFPVVASEDGHIFKPLATFFLHHGSESRIRFRPEETPTGPLESVDIDPPGGHSYRVHFAHMLEQYGVEVHDDSTLDDVETEFWSAFNGAPNDRFDDDQYFHSPWFDRCCGERRTVRSLARDWDDIYFQCRPRKTLNRISPTPGEGTLAAPTNLQVVQFNHRTVGLTLLEAPVVPPGHPSDHLKVLVVLKV
jgi:hypothetical protein